MSPAACREKGEVTSTRKTDPSLNCLFLHRTVPADWAFHHDLPKAANDTRFLRRGRAIFAARRPGEIPRKLRASQDFVVW